MEHLAPSEIPAYLKRHVPRVEKTLSPNDYRPHWWQFGKEQFPTAAAAHQARLEHMLEVAIFIAGGLEPLVRYPTYFPQAMQRMIQTRWRKEKGRPRKTGWRWSEASRAKLSASRKSAAPRQPQTPFIRLDESGRMIGAPSDLAACPVVRISGADLLKIMMP